MELNTFKEIFNSDKIETPELQDCQSIAAGLWKIASDCNSAVGMRKETWMKQNRFLAVFHGEKWITASEAKHFAQVFGGTQNDWIALCGREHRAKNN